MAIEYKKIDGYNYKVGTDGSVISLHRKGRLLKPRTVNGYQRVALYNDGICKDFFVHVLIANAFIPKHKNGLEVNHKDLVRSNNNIDNLEWVTRAENMQHSYYNGRNKKSTPIISICLNTGNEVSHKCIVDAGLYLNNDTRNISQVLSGKASKSKGYTFKYI